jgi:hypothetical protein
LPWFINNIIWFFNPKILLRIFFSPNMKTQSASYSLQKQIIYLST